MDICKSTRWHVMSQEKIDKSKECVSGNVLVGVVFTCVPNHRCRMAVECVFSLLLGWHCYLVFRSHVKRGTSCKHGTNLRGS